jgi:hypothetical protein
MVAREGIEPRHADFQSFFGSLRGISITYDRPANSRRNSVIFSAAADAAVNNAPADLRFAPELGCDAKRSRQTVSASRSASSSWSRARIEAISVSLFSAIWLDRLAHFSKLSFYTVPARQSNGKVPRLVGTFSGANCWRNWYQQIQFRCRTPARNN